MTYNDYLGFDPNSVVATALKTGVACIVTKQPKPRNPLSKYKPEYYQREKEHRRVMKQIRRHKNIAMGLTGEGKPRSTRNKKL